MGRYLFLKIIALILFGVAMFIVPIAIPFVILIILIIYGIRLIAHSGDMLLTPGQTAFFFILGIVVFFGSFKFSTKVSNWIFSSEHGLPIVWSIITLFAGGYFKSFPRQEERNFYIDEQINKFTKYNPHLLIGAGLLRLVIELFCMYAKEMAPYAKYLDIATTIGIVMFVASIVMYLVRTIHIYRYNR